MPVRIDRSEPPARGLPPGTYFLVVKDCEQKTSQSKSESMLHVTFKVASGPHKGEEVEDYFMLEGKGRGIGQQKLEALGIDWRGDFEDHELIGKRAYAAIVRESREYQGKTYSNARINVKAEDSKCGLWPEDAPPDGIDAEAIAADTDDEGPF